MDCHLDTHHCNLLTWACVCPPTPPWAHTTIAPQILLDAQGGLKVVIPEEPPENSGLLAVFVDNSNM
jgi:hypothetical protein